MLDLVRLKEFFSLLLRLKSQCRVALILITHDAQATLVRQTLSIQRVNSLGIAVIGVLALLNEALLEVALRVKVVEAQVVFVGVGDYLASSGLSLFINFLGLFKSLLLFLVIAFTTTTNSLNTKVPVIAKSISMPVPPINLRGYPCFIGMNMPWSFTRTLRVDTWGSRL